MAETSLIEVGATFAAIAAAGAVADRLRQSVIPFYLVVGILAGPFGLGLAGLPHVARGAFVDVAAELGIVFLLFFLGLEFSPDRLLANWENISKAGAVDLALNAPVGLVVGLALGWSLVEAVLLAGIVYVSSSAVITKSLIDLGWIANDESEPMLGTLVFEDVAIAVYLAVVSAVVVGAGGLETAARDVGVAVGFLLALVGVVHGGRPLFQRLLDVGSREATLLRTVAATVLIAGVALLLGVSEAVAAFFVGMGFSTTDHVVEIEDLLEPLRDVFAAVFFFWIGLGTDPRLLAGVAGVLVLLVVATGPGKLASGYLGGRIYGLDARRSARVGAGMVTRGEFSLVVATVAAAGSGEVMTEVIPAVAVGYVLAMSVLGTLLMQRSGPLERAAERWFGDASGAD